MKYQAPITAEQVILSTPLATAQLHSHTNMVPAIAHPAHSLTCHSQAVLLGKGFRAYPIKVSRKIKVKKGIDAMRDTRRVKGESASRNGLSINVFVANVRIAEVVRISCGRVRRRLEVIKPRIRGIIANSRNLRNYMSDIEKIFWNTYPTVSPHVGSEPSSHMKLPMNAHKEEIKRATGTKTDVADKTG